MFKPARTLAQYEAHLAKATNLLKQPTDWIWPDIRTSVLGLANAHDISFKFENFLVADYLMRLIRHQTHIGIRMRGILSVSLSAPRTVGAPSLSEGLPG